MKPVSGKELGRAGEALAADYLAGLGYAIIGRNIMAGHKEIDLVCFHRGTLVFVEVKSARSRKYGGADEIFSSKKTRNLRTAVTSYLAANRPRYRDLRLDLVYIDFSGKRPAITHYRDIA